MTDRDATLRDIVSRCDKTMAHAWMVRTFIKHCEEVDEFPELMGMVRAVFDTSRALETRIGDPPAYLHMLKKKIGKLRKAAEQFRRDAAVASTHTNFQQAVVSMDACIEELEGLLAVSPESRVESREQEEPHAEEPALLPSPFGRGAGGEGVTG